MIDLSKAYAGQIAHLNDGKELTIYSIKENEGKYIITFPLFVLAYDVNGKFLEPIEPKGLHKIPNIDINYLEHDYFAQIARLEGEIKGLEYTLDLFGSQFIIKRDISNKIEQLKTELSNLQNNQ